MIAVPFMLHTFKDTQLKTIHTSNNIYSKGTEQWEIKGENKKICLKSQSKSVAEAYREAYSLDFHSPALSLDRGLIINLFLTH